MCARVCVFAIMSVDIVFSGNVYSPAEAGIEMCRHPVYALPLQIHSCNLLTPLPQSSFIPSVLREHTLHVARCYDLFGMDVAVDLLLLACSANARRHGK